MASKTIETLKLLLPYRFYLFTMVLLLALFIYNHNETLILEKRLNEINKELHQQQVTFERRQKAYYEQRKLQQAKIERMVKEIKSEK